MEYEHHDRIRAKFGSIARYLDVRVLDIPDDFGFMEEALVQLLTARIREQLGDDALS